MGRMSSLEFKELSVRFGSGLKVVDENLYLAVEGELSEDEVAAAITDGKAKLREFDELLDKLDDIKTPQIIERYGDRVSDIRSAIGQLEGESGGTP